MKIAQVSTGFLEVPGQISLNIFAQGCKIKCDKCHMPELQEFNGGTDLTLENVSTLEKQFNLSKWICWLGGDATYQPDDLIKLNKYFKSQNKFIALYTGKELNDIKDLLENVDLVKTGKYIGKTIFDKDTNQKFWIRKNNDTFTYIFNNKLKEIIARYMASHCQ